MSKYKLPKIEELLDAGTHFGHQIRRWNPRMEPYIYTHKKNIHVIDLEDTEKNLKKACEFLYETASNGGKIIFVGTKKQARDIVKIEAERSGAFHITERWLGGTITNFGMIKKSINRLVDLMRKREKGELKMYTKKERLLIDREIAKLQTSVGGIVGLKGKPDAVFIVDVRREKTAVRESRLYNVPIVGLVDTNSDPTQIDYVIPGNDDAIKSIAVIVKAISNAVEAGYKEFSKSKEGKKEAEAKETTTVSEKSEESPKTKAPAIVTSTEAPHATEKAGKKYAKELEKEYSVSEKAAEKVTEETEVEETIEDKVTKEDKKSKKEEKPSKGKAKTKEAKKTPSKTKKDTKLEEKKEKPTAKKKKGGTKKSS